MRTIQVLGPGCSKCSRLASNAERAASESGPEVCVEKVREIARMLTFEGVSALPALAIDGEVRVCGRVPGVDEIKNLLKRNCEVQT